MRFEMVKCFLLHCTTFSIRNLTEYNLTNTLFCMQLLIDQSIRLSKTNADFINPVLNF